MLTANMKMIAECADKLAHLGEKLLNMTEMKYRAGNKVRIKSLDWYHENKDNHGVVYAGNGFFFWNYMAGLCGEIMTISSIKVDPEDSNKGYYFMENSEEKWTDEMIEGLVEEDVDLIPKFGEYSDNEPLDIPTMTTDFIKEYGLPCPNGYIFKDENGNVINATKIVLEKKKKEYPKTYEECREILKEQADVTYGYKKGVLHSFQKLIICRDAYWKIAGEEMGLGKPWSPDYDSGVDKFGIICMNGVVQEYNPTTNWERHLNKVLDFPTRAMRDAFYENFKELIEECKELL